MTTFYVTEDTSSYVIDTENPDVIIPWLTTRRVDAPVVLTDLPGRKLNTICKFLFKEGYRFLQHQEASRFFLAVKMADIIKD